MTGRDLGSWFCADQTSLLDLVETEHIPGSMPADDAGRAAAREEWYQMGTSGLMALVIDCENDLGWVPEGRDIWKARAAHAGQLRQAMTSHSYSEDDLRLAMAWCRRKRHQIQQPTDLLALVQQAKREAAAVEHTTDLDQEINAAIRWEMVVGHDEHQWISRLVRCRGPLRADVLQEWRDDGRGPDA